jgi:hypothetical protein
MSYEELDVRPLAMRPQLCLETSAISHPMKRCSIPEEQMPQLRRYESLTLLFFVTKVPVSRVLTLAPAKKKQYFQNEPSSTVKNVVNCICKNSSMWNFPLQLLPYWPQIRILLNVFPRHSMCSLSIQCVPSAFSVFPQHSACSLSIQRVPSAFSVFPQHSVCSLSIQCVPSAFNVFPQHSMCSLSIQCVAPFLNGISFCLRG